MSRVYVKKAQEDVMRNFDDYRASSANRDVRALDLGMKPYEPISRELQGAKVLRKIPRRGRWGSRGAAPGAILESAVGRALANLGYPIEPEFPIRVDEDGNLIEDDRITGNPRWGATEQRIAEMLADDPRLKHKVFRNLQYQLGNKAGLEQSRRLSETEPRRGLPAALGTADMKEENIGEFADEGGSIPPVRSDFRLPLIPEKIPKGRELSQEAKDMLMFDSKGNLRPTLRKPSAMRMLDYFMTPRHEPQMWRTDMGDIGWDSPSKSTELPYETWSKVIDTLRDKNPEIKRDASVSWTRPEDFNKDYALPLSRFDEQNAQYNKLLVHLGDKQTLENLPFNQKEVLHPDYGPNLMDDDGFIKRVGNMFDDKLGKELFGIHDRKHLKGLRKLLDQSGLNDRLELMREIPASKNELVREIKNLRDIHSKHHIGIGYDPKTHDKVQELIDTSYPPRNSGIRDEWNVLRNFLSRDNIGELSDFVAALPPISEYDEAWSPTEREIASISAPKGARELPSGFEPLTMTDAGHDVQGRLQMHNQQRAKYQRFKERMGVLASMVKDPEQMRLWEFNHPEGRMLADKIRDVRNRNLSALLPEGKPSTESVFDPDKHPLLEERVNDSDLDNYDETDHFDSWYGTPSYIPSLLPQKHGIVDIRQNYNPSTAFDVGPALPSWVNPPKSSPKGLGDLSDPDNMRDRDRRNVLDKVMEHNDWIWDITHSEAAKMIDNWDDNELMLARNMDNVALDYLGHNDLLPEWLGQSTPSSPEDSPQSKGRVTPPWTRPEEYVSGFSDSFFG